MVGVPIEDQTARLKLPEPLDPPSPRQTPDPPCKQAEVAPLVEVTSQQITTDNEITSHEKQTNSKQPARTCNMTTDWNKHVNIDMAHSYHERKILSIQHIYMHKYQTNKHAYQQPIIS